MGATVEELYLIFERALEGVTQAANIVATHTLAGITNSNPNLISVLVRKIENCLHSQSPIDINHVLDILETIMSFGHQTVRIEVGKSAFLDKIVKLLSPKINGEPTVPTVVRDRLMDLMLVWASQYPEIRPIKRAYMVLRKKGVPHNVPNDDRVQSYFKQTTERVDIKALIDEIPKELLSSTDPVDIHASKLMVEQAWMRKTQKAELQKSHEQVLKEATEISSILQDMLNNHSSKDDFELTTEIYEQCRLHQIVVSHFAVDPSNKDADKWHVENDNLKRAMHRYTALVIDQNVKCDSDLLTLVMNCPPVDVIEPSLPLQDHFDYFDENAFAELDDIFHRPGADHRTVETALTSLITLWEASTAEVSEISNALLQPIVDTATNRPTERNATTKIAQAKYDFSGIADIVSELKTNLSQTAAIELPDDIIPVDADDSVDAQPECVAAPVAPTANPKIAPRKALAQLVIDVDRISPSAVPSKVMMDDAHGLRLVLHFAVDTPRADVATLVITTTNQSSLPMSGYQLEASVPRPFKLRLLPQSGSALPAVKPFRLPSQDITQVLLVAHQPSDTPIDLVCIVTYCLGDDPDPFKETIVTPNLPLTELSTTTTTTTR